MSLYRIWGIPGGGVCGRNTDIPCPVCNPLSLAILTSRLDVLNLATQIQS